MATTRRSLWARRSTYLVLLVALVVAADADVAQSPYTCEPCCNNNSTNTQPPLCCEPGPLNSVVGGACVALPCCVNGRFDADEYKKNRKPWKPCLKYPGCRLDEDLCSVSFLPNDTSQSFPWQCTKPCCSNGFVTDYTWDATQNNMPGQTNAVVEMTFDPNDYSRVLISNGEPAGTSILEIFVRIPTGWAWNTTTGGCTIQDSKTINASPVSGLCRTMQWGAYSYIGLNLKSVAALSAARFRVVLTNVSTPKSVLPPEHFPIYFTAKLPNVDYRVYISAGYVRSVNAGRISQPAFFTANILSQAVSNATLIFVSDVLLPKQTQLKLDFLNSGYTVGECSFFYKSRPLVATYKPDPRVWTVTLPEDIAPNASVLIDVHNVRNPESLYQERFTSINITASAGDSMLAQGVVVTTIMKDLQTSLPSSPYNWISLVLLVLSLTFCFLMLFKHGLGIMHWSFHPIAIFSDMTAITAVTGLLLGLVNNVLWISGDMKHMENYFTIKCGVTSLAFTMLLSVCCHWASVLSPPVRKLPKFSLFVLFLCLNACYYAFQFGAANVHQDTIRKVYEAESTTNMQDPVYTCKNGTTFQYVFSDIQPYFALCYMAKQHLSVADQAFFTWFSNTTYSVSALLTLGVLFLGLMVMHRGSKIMQLIAYSPQQIYLMKALRLYTSLIGVVTATYLIAFSMQFVQNEVPYYVWYLTTVWLPQCVPPCCFIFLQWNSATKSLRKNDEETDCSCEAVVTPRIVGITFAEKEDDDGSEDLPLDRGTTVLVPDTYLDDDEDEVLDDLPSSVVTSSSRSFIKQLDAEMLNQASSFGVSLRLLVPQHIPRGCYVAIETQDDAGQWVRGDSTDTLVPETVRDEHHVAFLSVPQILLPLTSSIPVRFLVYTARTPSTHYGASTIKSNASSSSAHSTPLDGLEYLEEESDSDDEDDEDDEDQGDDDMLFVSPSDQCVCSFQMDVEQPENCSFLLPCRLDIQMVRDHELRRTHLSMLQNNAPKAHTTTLFTSPADTLLTAQFHLQDQDILVVEDLMESPYTNVIPCQYLDIILARRTKEYLLAEQELKQFLASKRRGCSDSSRWCRDWLVERAKLRRDYVVLLKRARHVVYVRESRQLRFKASTQKKDSLLRFLPINLHVQEMHVAKSKAANADAAIYETITVGAFAAHVHKFKNGGLHSMQQAATKLRSPLKVSNMFPSTWQYLSQSERKRVELEWAIETRLDVVVPQALSTLVTAFCHKLQLIVSEDKQAPLDQLLYMGFLFEVESLLSTHGTEIGMLEDMMVAVASLKRVRMLLVEDDVRASSPSEAKAGNPVVCVELYTNMDDALLGARTHAHAKSTDDEFVVRVVLKCLGKVHVPRRKATVVVHPLLFSTGINEKQTLAMSTHNHKRLQDYINEVNIVALRPLVAAYVDQHGGTPDAALVQETMALLEAAVQASMASRKKMPEVLQLSSRIVRLLHGGRVTVCKSAKDRTGMSVTLEQGHLLHWNHELPKAKIPEIVSTMRSRGVRIENALKNTGRRRFAFNALQRSMLPEEYRCPPETGGRNMS
ncbi:hypothetical protein SPRG_02396 [Saprolegnia parasitica CBS 223.65]|uniref:Inositol-3,4-bisphosphate 4-phosphatase n=1 Tax=Saprolegnia parasitica (strain CBS 223.65) TaxID=695850 RepID=A0A067D1U9_SAPPC|nr:hypothetical protein SPRG_02396 [Saprolegnia parasitica CBS 223.65]KDO32696.1 hypothetical protein SPRG_02396 [Saprolegnia parasitica CBS 223.65]|eukprot:XP_012196362.1 hypothetical protein SPRG_02396 [Saprolegnia parasitica CBS 223.65]